MMKPARHCLSLLILGAAFFLLSRETMAQDFPKKYLAIEDSLVRSGLGSCMAYDFLQELTSAAPHRLGGSEGAAKAVEITKRMLERLGFSNVHLEPCLVPHWVRGPIESAQIIGRSGVRTRLSVCALGGSIATPSRGLTAEVVEVRSFEELKDLGDRAKGKIIFFNRPFDPTKLQTFESYSGAVDQRGRGAIMAAMAGGVAALVRSATGRLDDVPHTGAMGYADSVRKVPAAAVSTVGADRLSAILKLNPHVKIRLVLTCKTLPDAPSANVVGEITGSVKPDEVIVVGGHLDCWDKGSGAHDDGSGCVQAIEALRLLRDLGLKPARTIRAVMFMNEENGLRGGKAYEAAPQRLNERHIAALESDRGGFAPRGFDVQADTAVFDWAFRLRELFARIDAGEIHMGGSGVDISPLVQSGVPGFGLAVESHRYFDYHHSDNDTIDKVNPRELEMGAIVEALLCYVLAEEGLPRRGHGN